MGQSLLNQPHLQNEKAAHEFLVKLRWPDGIRCVRCQSERVRPLKVKSAKRQVLKCYGCRKQFSATIGTIFEDSHIPLTKWLTAMQLLCSSKKGMSAKQLQRMLNFKSYETAWFMAHRLRHAMTQFHDVPRLKGVIEADETYVGGKEKGKGNKTKKVPVFALVQRGGDVRSFVMPRVTAKNLKTVLTANVEQSAQLMTDSFVGYKDLGTHFAGHESVNHSAKEYVRGPAHTNTVEGYFSLLKRGIIGTYHHVSEKHLHRYLAEFDFRYNARKTDDTVRALLAMKGTEGKRLQYQQ
jgi:transposase-like protein